MANDFLPTERVGLVVHALACGRELTVRDLAEQFSLTHRGARSMLERLSRVLPIVVDESAAGGVWRMMNDNDAGN